MNDDTHIVQKFGEHYIARDGAVMRTTTPGEVAQQLAIIFSIALFTITRLTVSMSGKGLLLLLLLVGAYIAVKVRTREQLVIAVRDGYIELPKQTVSVELEGVPASDCRPMRKPVGDLLVTVEASFVILLSCVPGQPRCWVVDDLGTPEFARNFTAFLVESLALNAKPTDADQWPPAPVARPDAV